MLTCEEQTRQIQLMKSFSLIRAVPNSTVSSGFKILRVTLLNWSITLELEL